MADIVKFSSGMRALISSHSEEEDYIPLTEAIRSPGTKGKLDYSQRETLRKNMIELFLKLFGSGVAAVDSTNLRFIRGHEYNMFLRYRDKLRHLSYEVNSLERLKAAYGNDVNAILYDAMSGRAVMDAQTRKLVMSLAESALRKQIGVAFDILGVSRTMPGNPDNAIFLTGVSETDSVIQVGAVDVVDLVNFVRSGSEYIMARSKRGGAVRVRTCDALKQILSFMVGKTDVEKARKVWREGFRISRASRPDPGPKDTGVAKFRGGSFLRNLDQPTKEKD